MKKVSEVSWIESDWLGEVLVKAATSGRVGKDHLFGTVTLNNDKLVMERCLEGTEGRESAEALRQVLVDHVLERWTTMQPLQAQEWGASFSEQMMGSYSLTHSK